MEPKTVSDLDEATLPGSQHDSFNPNSNAVIFYSSGMTGRARGVVYTHQSLGNTVEAAVETWRLASSDSVLHCLDLDSVYGSVLCLHAPLSTGARVTMIPSHDPTKVTL